MDKEDAYAKMAMTNLVNMFEKRFLCPSCPDSDCDSDCNSDDDCNHYYNTHSVRVTLKSYLKFGIRVPDHLLIQASNYWDSNYFTKTMAIVRKFQDLPQEVETRYLKEGGSVYSSESSESSDSSSTD
jgi:hypothetical protein